MRIWRAKAFDVIVLEVECGIGILQKPIGTFVVKVD